MKKLLVLSLVLAIGAVSSAALTLTVDKTTLMPGEVATFTISDTNTEGYVAYIIIEEGGIGSLAFLADLQGSNQSSADLYTEDGWGAGFELSFADTRVGHLTPGSTLSFTFSSAVEGIAIVSLWDDAVGYDAPVGAFTMSVIPEPMTMGLLGLGALFLRKRK